VKETDAEFLERYADWRKSKTEDREKVMGKAEEGPMEFYGTFITIDTPMETKGVPPYYTKEELDLFGEFIGEVFSDMKKSGHKFDQDAFEADRTLRLTRRIEGKK